MPSGDFHDYDDEFGASNLFDFSNSPDTLQSLETIGTNESKNFLNPQELTASAPDALPDSPNESYHDSSSESASSTKRAGSSASAKTPATTADTAMEDGKDVKMEWANPNYSAFDDEDNAFAFGREADPSVMMDAMYGFGEHDDTFMDRSFDFEGASSSPEAAVGSQINMPSPGMPTIKTTSPKKTAQPNRAKAPNHKKQPSVSAPR